MTQPKISIVGNTMFVAQWPEAAKSSRLQIILRGTATHMTATWDIAFTKPGTTTRWEARFKYIWDAKYDGAEFDVEAMLTVAPTAFYEGGTVGKGVRQLSHDTRMWTIPVILTMVREVADDIRAWIADPLTMVATEVASAKSQAAEDRRAVEATEAGLAKQRQRLAEAEAKLEAAMARYRAVEAGE